MFWETSLKTLTRSKGKTILLGVLLSLISIFTVLGYSMLDNCNHLLKQADEEYTTIGVLEYTAGKYPDDTQITEKSKEVIQQFDTDKITKQPQVIDYQKPYLLLGYSDKIKKAENQDTPFYYNSVIVFRVSFANQDGTYRCTLIDPLYSNCSKEGTTFGLSKETLKNQEKYNLESKHLYIANGDFRIEDGLLVFSLSTHTGMSESKMKDVKIANFPLVDLTNSPNYLTEGKESNEWKRIKEFYQVQNTSIQVTAVKSIENYTDFYLGASILSGGRLWTDQESNDGKKVCVVHASVAAKMGLKVGDQFDLKTHYSDDSRFFYDSINSKNNFRETQTYEIIGIYHKLADNSAPMIFVPQSSLKNIPDKQQRYNMLTVTIKNGEGRTYQKLVEKELNNHFAMTVYDQGYEQTVSPIYAMRTNACLILILCGCCCLVILVLFGLLFVVKQKETIAIMTSLGTKKRSILYYITSGAFMIGGIACLLSTLLAYCLSKSAVKFAYEMTKNAQQKDLRYSILSMGKQHVFHGEIKGSIVASLIISLIILIAVLIICLYNGIKVINETKNFGGQIRKKKAKKGKNYSRTKVKEARFEHEEVLLTPESFSKRRARFFLLITSKKSLFSNRKVNTILVLISFCICIFMTSYTMGIEKYGEMIDQAYKNIEVNSSFRTVTGRKISAENIPSSVYNYMSSAYNVKNYYRSIMNKYEYVGAMDSPKKDKDLTIEKMLVKKSIKKTSHPQTGFGMEERIKIIKEDSTFAIVDDINRSEEFFREKPSEITFLKGYEKIFEKPIEDDWNVTKANSEMPVLHVVVTKDFLKTKDLKLGDGMIISHIILDRSGETFYSEPLKCKIVGEYASKVDGETIYMSRQEKDLKITSEAILTQLLTTDVNYRMRNMDNLNLLKSKLEAEEVYSVGIWSASRVSFVMEDARLIETVNSYENGRSFMKNLRYTLFLIIFLVGFVATYLAMRSRVSEMAIMRSLGTGSRRVFLIFFLEQTALAIIGTILGLTVSMIYYKGIQIQELGMIGLFLVFFLSGSIISIIQMNKKNVLKILSTAE